MAMEALASVYPTKRDNWIVILLWVGAAGMVFAAADVLTSPTPVGFRIVFAVVTLAGAGFVLWILYSTYYVLEGQQLLIRCGPFRKRIVLTSIEEVSPTRSPLSSPACSLDRLRVRYQGSRFGIMISPENKEAFLDDLRSRSPSLILENGRLLRKEDLT